MKLYDGGKAPNPRRVRIFLAEKGIEIPLHPVDMGTLGHRSDEVTSRNPLQRLPMLELDDGTIITESIAICRYFEELHPNPPLMGKTALEKATIEMWQRRMELNLLLMVANVFRHAHPAMAQWEVPQIAELSETSRPKAIKFMTLVNDELATRPFIAGDEFSIADITGMIALDFCKPARIEIPPELDNLQKWYGEISARASANA